MNITIRKVLNIFQVNESKIANHLYSKGFGIIKTSDSSSKNSEQILILDPLEVLYIVSHKKRVSLENFTVENSTQFLSEFSIPYYQYLVYEDLIKKGYFVKQALKFGAQFRIYDKNTQIDTSPHATHLVIICDNSKQFSSEELFSINRVAHSTRKKILLAFVDYELSINYIEQSRWK